MRATIERQTFERICSRSILMTFLTPADQILLSGNVEDHFDIIKFSCQFDFRRLASIGCPWGKRPQRITDRNVAARAEMLADQYRKKAQLYRMNTLLVPLGDDFRYDSSTEWEDQYENYRQLFNYMNSKQELNINVSLGSLLGNNLF